MTNIQNEIIKKIEEYSTIIIHRHINPDPDALGSQGGLQKIIQASFPEKKVYVVGEEVESLLFLNRMDQISDEVYNDALVIVCDTANIPRISDERFKLGSYIIKIDHHPDREPFGDLSWVDTTYSSTSEMIMDLYLKHQDTLTLNQEAARLLYAGIIGDTGRFLYDNTTSRTMRYASKLLEWDIEPQEIYNNLYKMDRNTARLQGYVLFNYEVTKEGVAYFKMTKEILDEFGVDKTSAANLVNVLSNIEGNKVWVFFIEYPEEIRVRIRSAKTPINEVAYQFNGGGHPLASGATIYSWDEMDNLINALNKTVRVFESYPGTYLFSNNKTNLFS